MRHRLIFIVIPLLAAGPALADDPPAPKPKPPREKKICRTEEVIGSIIPQSICKTAAQWQQIDDENQRNADDAMARRSGGPSTSGGADR